MNIDEHIASYLAEIARQFATGAATEHSYRPALAGSHGEEKSGLMKQPHNSNPLIRVRHLCGIPAAKKIPWNSYDEAIKEAKCIQKEDGEAFFADEGHTGMIKKGYWDKYFPQKSKGMIWRIK